MSGQPLSRTAARIAPVAFLFLVLLGAVASIGCEARRAERDLAEAQRLGADGETAAAAEKLRLLVASHPDTDAAVRARALLETYEGLIEAAYRNRIRDAVDTLRKTARAVEIFHEARRTLPISLAVLVPDYLSEAQADPWGRPLGYSMTAGHYEVFILGADGLPGGEGQDQDVRVADGRLVQAPSWFDR